MERNGRENNYITDETVKNLKSAVSELECCGIGTGSASSKIEKPAWIDPLKNNARPLEIGSGFDGVNNVIQDAEIMDHIKHGALAGAATGPAAPIAVPTFGLVGGIGGAFGGDALGKWIVDITCAED